MNAAVHIETVVKTGKTLLQQACCTQPFKVMDITEDTREGVLRLMLMSSSPGILDEDVYNIDIRLVEYSAVELQTQTYQRLFSMKKGASQHMLVRLQKGASFKFLPHPVVPHESSDFRADNKIFLSDSCTLIWGEVLTCGRKLSGEIFRFNRYHSVTEIFLHDKLVMKETLFMEPASMQLFDIGQSEGFTHQAGLFFLQEAIPVKEVIALISDRLNAFEEILYGITAAPVNGIIIRMLGNKAEQLFNCMKTISEIFHSLQSPVRFVAKNKTQGFPVSGG